MVRDEKRRGVAKMKLTLNLQKRWSFDKAAFECGSPELGESQGSGESLRLSPVSRESSKLSPKTGESFRGELFDIKEL